MRKEVTNEICVILIRVKELAETGSPDLVSQQKNQKNIKISFIFSSLCKPSSNYFCTYIT